MARLPIAVHGPADPWFTAGLVDVARKLGVSAYIGDGSNRWSAVHRLDAARLIRLAIENPPPAGSILHGVADTGVATRDIATAIGVGLNLPVESITVENAWPHFDWLSIFFGLDAPAFSDTTRQQLNWTPVEPTLLEDLAPGGSYFNEMRQ